MWTKSLNCFKFWYIYEEKKVIILNLWVFLKEMYLGDIFEEY